MAKRLRLELKHVNSQNENIFTIYSNFDLHFLAIEISILL